VESIDIHFPIKDKYENGTTFSVEEHEEDQRALSPSNDASETFVNFVDTLRRGCKYSCFKILGV
jgi:hypothetical protein